VIVNAWLLYGTLALLAGGVAGIVYVTIKQNATRRELDQARRDLDQTRSELDQARRDLEKEKQALRGHGMSELHHKILLMRLAGFKLGPIAEAVSCDDATVDNKIHDLKEMGLLPK